MNLNNVFDKRYWIPGFAEQNGNNDFGDPRNVMFTLKYTPRTERQACAGTAGTGRARIATTAQLRPNSGSTHAQLLQRDAGQPSASIQWPGGVIRDAAPGGVHLDAGDVAVGAGP